MNTEDQPSLLVIQCRDEITKDDSEYFRHTEDRLDKIAAAFSIEKTTERWERVSVENIIGILGAAQLSEAAYDSLEKIVDAIDTHAGTVIVLSTHEDCQCTFSEDVAVRLSRAALRFDQMLGEKTNQYGGTNWSISGMKFAREDIVLETPTTAHIYNITELRMMSGGEVDLSVLLEIELSDSGEVDSNDLLEASAVSDSEKTTRPVSLRAVEKGIAQAQKKQHAGDSQEAELLTMSSFAIKVRDALSTASVRQARLVGNTPKSDRLTSGSGILRKPKTLRRHS